MIKNISNFIIIIIVVALSISIIFSLATITTIETTYANHTKYHLNNSLVDVTISSDDDIPDALLEDIKRGIIRDMKAEEKKAIEKNNNISQLQTTEKTTDTTKAKIILTSHKYAETPDDDSYDELFGQVKNVGNGTAEDISIIFTYYDINSNAIGNDDTGIYADILHPGQKSPFQEWRNLEKTPDMAYYEIALSWYNSDGTQEYIENVEVTKDPQEKITPFIENPKQTNNENENFPFFNTDGNDIEKLGNEENEEDEDDDDEDEDEEDEDEDEEDEDEDEDNDDKDNN